MENGYQTSCKKDLDTWFAERTKNRQERESTFVRHLGPCAYPSYGDMGQIPVSALWGIVYARWGQRLGQKKAAGENNNLCKQKDPKPSGNVHRDTS